jgi:hypothetical protein
MKITLSITGPVLCPQEVISTGRFTLGISGWPAGRERDVPVRTKNKNRNKNV